MDRDPLGGGEVLGTAGRAGHVDPARGQLCKQATADVPRGAGDKHPGHRRKIRKDARGIASTLPRPRGLNPDVPCADGGV